jgi:hypothetical protein
MAERLVVEDSYPIELFGLVETDETRYGNRSFWASAESLSGTEFLTVEFRQPCYFNNITLKIAQKPCNIEFFYSNDNATWSPVLGETGEELSYLISSWGGTSSMDSMMLIEVETQLNQAKYLKLTFERIEVSLPNLTTPFPYSIDVSDLTINHIIESPSDYPFTQQNPHSFDDIFSNRASSEIDYYESELCVDGVPNTYWMSQANVVSDAVEYLCFDISAGGETSIIDSIDIDPVYGGCQMNIYFSDSDGDYANKEWEPVPDSFVLRRGLLRIPLINAKYIKLEFTRLVPVPYTVVVPNQKVATRKFPDAVKQYFERLEQSDVVSDDMAQLLYVSDEVGRDVPFVYGYDVVGIDNPERLTTVADKSRESRLDVGIPNEFPDLTDSLMYQTDLTENMQNSDVLFGLSGVCIEDESFGSELVPNEDTVSRHRFYQCGTHDYAITYEERISKVAYLVGIREVKFCLMDNSEALEGEPFLETFAKTRMTSSTTWVPSSDSAKMVASTVPAVYVSNAFRSIRKFRAFHFVAQQKRQTQSLSNGDFEDDPVSPDSTHWVAHEGGGESVTIEWDASGIALSGNCLRVNRDGVGSFGGVQTDLLSIASGGTAKVTGSILVPEEVLGDWLVAVFDDSGAPVQQKYIYPTANKWTEFEMTYNPLPYGGWWDASFGYRQQITVAGGSSGVSSNAAVFVFADDEALHLAGKVREDRHDWRVVYFDGRESYEISRDYTGVGETWFKIQADIPPDSFDYGYFIYYGTGIVDPGEPLAVLTDVFSLVTAGVVTEYPANSTFSIESNPDCFLGDGEGSIALMYTPKFDPDVDILKDGDAAVRYITSVATASGGRVELFAFQNYLFLEFYEAPEPDGSAFRSTISCVIDALTEDTTYSLIADWGVPSSSGDGLRRDMAIYIDGAEQTENTQYYGEIVQLRYDDAPPRTY